MVKFYYYAIFSAYRVGFTRSRTFMLATVFVGLVMFGRNSKKGHSFGNRS